MSAKNTTITKSVISPNLLPHEEKDEQYYDTIAKTLKRLIQFAFLLLLVLWALGGLLILRIDQQEKNLVQGLQTEVNREKLKELSSINAQLKELRILNGKVDRAQKSEFLFSNLLEELSKIVPQNVALTAFETIVDQPGWIKIKGVARTRDNFLKFKESLESSEYCAKVESPLSNYVTPESFSFELNIQLKDWKPVWTDEVKKKAKKHTTIEEEL